MTPNNLQKTIDKQYAIIDSYFQRRYKMASTLERIKIRNVQKAINKLVETEILLETESNQ